MESEKLLKLAMATYIRSGDTGQPDDFESETVTDEGRHYAVLANANGILAVYRLRDDGLTLRRLASWPKAIDTQF